MTTFLEAATRLDAELADLRADLARAFGPLLAWLDRQLCRLGAMLDPS